MRQVFSFKVRGAFNKLAQLSAEELSRGVICASAGNHAQGVALAARTLVRPQHSPCCTECTSAMLGIPCRYAGSDTAQPGRLSQGAEMYAHVMHLCIP